MAEKSVSEMIQSEHEKGDGEVKTPGTLVLVIILLLSFAIYYFANWKALAETWHVR